MRKLDKNFQLERFNLHVRLVNEDDAQYIIKLRTDTKLGMFLNPTQNDLEAQKQWIRDNLQYVTDKDAIARIAILTSAEPDVANYLYVSGRCAVAHAFDQNNVVNPDDPADLIRLHEDLPVIRELARVAIEREFGVKSTRDFQRENH